VDKDWLVIILSTLNQDHRYFDKDYRATAEELREEDDGFQGLMVDNTDDFFDGLPEQSGKKKKRGRNIFISKQQKEEAKFSKLEHRAMAIQQKIQKLKDSEEQEVQIIQIRGGQNQSVAAEDSEENSQWDQAMIDSM